MWRSRNLTFEGRSLIIKTFGLSQLIYNLQVYELKKESITEIERAIFGFIWLSNKSTAERGIDRIKRAVLKNDYSEGGLNITDVECLNKSLKLRQFVKASKSNHPIKVIQQYCIEQLGFRNVVQQEYHRITKKEQVTRMAQITINNICDYTRKSILSDPEKHSGNIIVTNLIASTDIKSYLLRENKRLAHCVYNPLRNEGIEWLHELCTEKEIERDREKVKRIKMVIANFPAQMIEIAAAYDPDVNNDSLGLTHILMKGETWKEIDKITTRELQTTLKLALNKTSCQDFCQRLEIDNFYKDDIKKFRHQCKNIKLRHIFFRLISKDFFTMDRMYKRNMVNDNKCSRCGEVETYRHLLWECHEVRKVWQSYNDYMDYIGQYDIKVENYEEVFRVERVGVISTVKMKTVQQLIQIERPTGWNMERTRSMACDLKNIELYNASIVNNLHKVRTKWNLIY